MMKVNIDVKDLDMEARYLIDLGNSVEELRGRDVNGWRVFGDIDVYHLHTMRYIGTLGGVPYSALR